MFLLVIITFVCFCVVYLLSVASSYEAINIFFNSLFVKFIILGLTWSYSFQILSEIRHLIWDFGFGYDLNITKISGLIVILGSFLLTILIFLLGK